MATTFDPRVREYGTAGPASAGRRRSILDEFSRAIPVSEDDARSRRSNLPQRLGRLNTQRSARRCGARQHAHGRHDDGRDHRRDEEIRGQAVGAPREEQDETVAGNYAAAELTTRTGENGTQHASGAGAKCDADADLAG